MIYNTTTLKGVVLKKALIFILFSCCIFHSIDIYAQRPDSWKQEGECDVKDFHYWLYVDTITNKRYATATYIGSTTTVKFGKKVKAPNNKTYEIKGVAYSQKVNSNKKIQHVELSDNITFIDRDAFYDCSNLTDVEGCHNITYVGANSFHNCKSLKSFSAPVKKVGFAAFKDCSMLEYVAFENTEKIDAFSFAGCTKLKSIYIRGLESLRHIGDGSFWKCTSLQRLIDPQENNSGHLTSLIDLPNVTHMGGTNAFCECRSIESVRLSSELQSIAGGSFSDCDNLQEILFTRTANALDSIGHGAFMGCKSLTKIGDYSFGSVSHFRPKYIEQGAFAYCTSLKDINLFDIVYIGKSAFGGCTALESIVIGKTVQYIGDLAFSGCSSLKSIGEDYEQFDAEIVGTPFERTSFDATPLERNYKVYMRSVLTERIKRWQEKTEYETAAEYKERVTENSRNAKIAEYKDSIRAEYIAKYSPEELNCEIVSYDADGEVFKIKAKYINSYYGKDVYTYAKVPRSEAPKFKEQWENVKIEPTYCIAKNYLGIASCKFTLNSKTYESPILYDDETANVELNLSPLDIWKDNKNDMAQEKYDDTLDKNIPQTNMKNEKTFAVIIGNEYYKEVSNVSYAQNDAKVFAEYCKKTLGLPEDNVRSYQNATYGMMLSAVKDMKSISEAYDGDVNFIFYYVGHGIPDEKTREAYLLPIDANPMDMEACYPIGRLYTELGELQAHSVAVFMDACFSGAQRGEGMLVEARGVAIKTKSDAPKGNTIVFSAASGDETAYPYKDKGHGMFTYYLLKKLNETKGDVSLGELGDYITTQVKQQSVVINRKSQTPTVVPSVSIVDNWKNLKLTK